MAVDTDRILVFGDNHGNADTLQQVADETVGESFDYIVHVGDLTNTTQEGKDSRDAETIAADQIERIRPPLERLAGRGELVYIWGNRDGYGDPMPEDGLDVGTLIPRGESRTVDGQRFTTDPEAVDSETILVTHGPHVWAVDHFDGLAHFSGHTHKGRYRNRFLNSALLYRERGLPEPIHGGYFILDVGTEPPFNVEFRNLGDLKQIVCHEHIERGVGFQPDFHTCRYCYYEGELEEEILTSAYHALAERGATVEVEPEGGVIQAPAPIPDDAHARPRLSDDATGVHEAALLEYGCGLWNDPPDGFRRDFEAYLAALSDAHPTDSFVRTPNGVIVPQ